MNRRRTEIQNSFVLDTLRVMFIGSALLILVAVLFSALALSGVGRYIMIIAGLLVVSLFLAVHRLVVNGRFPNRFAHPVAAGLGSIGFSYQLYQMAVDSHEVTAMQLVGLTLTTIAAAAVFLSLRWLFGTLVVVLGSWSLFLLATEENAVWSEHIYLYVLLIVFALFIFYGRSRAVSAMINAQMENQRQNDQLAETLERAHLSEATLRAERDYAKQIIESLGQGLVLVDSDGRIEFTNPAAAQIVQIPVDGLIGRPASEIFRFESEPVGAPLKLDDVAREARIVTSDGSDRCVLFSGTPRGSGGGTITLTDLTLRKQFEAELQRLAHHDALTGLPNRALFMDRVMQAISRLDRHNARLAILFMDLDRFKWINDTMGHAVGDQVLVETARRIKQCIRDHDTAARFGGDEFVVLLTDLEDADEALTIAARISRQVQLPLSLEDRVHTVDVSIGISMSQSRDANPEVLLNHADIAMYRAKNRRDLSRVLYTPDMDTRPPSNSAFESDARLGVSTRRR